VKLPRDLLGRELAAVLCRDFGYTRVNQVGSHIILQTDSPSHHRVSIPDHKPLRIGTLNAIVREVASAKGVEKQAILDRI
jgi:predicted RNA binding protein YcfA (HicA-like mRNA interferase family)